MEVELVFLYSLSIYLSVPPLKVFFFSGKEAQVSTRNAAVTVALV